jgi:hypothetical protein
MKNDEEIIYQLSVVDIQEVATELLERRLTKKEVALVRDSVGDFIDWSQAIKHAINKHLDVK